MPRIRTIKPEFWAHPVMGRASDGAKCLALALLNLADDEGYFLASATLVRNFARPFDSDTITTESLITDLSRMGWIEVRDHQTHGVLGWIPNFVKHQAISRAKKSSLKAYFKDAVPRDPGRITDHSVQDPIRKGMEGKGMEEEESRARASKTNLTSPTAGSERPIEPRDPSPGEQVLAAYLRSDWPEVLDPNAVAKPIADLHGSTLDLVAIAKAARATWVGNGCKSKSGKPAAAYLVDWFNREAKGRPAYLQAGALGATSDNGHARAAAAKAKTRALLEELRPTQGRNGKR